MAQWLNWLLIVHVTLFGMLFLGTALVWSARAVYVCHGRRCWRQAIFRAVGWTLTGLLLVVIAWVDGASGGFVLYSRRTFTQVTYETLVASIGAPFLFLMAVLGVCWHEARNAVRRLALWTIEMAATKKLPYSLALRALGVEYPGFMGLRLIHVADRLDLGLPLPVALRAFGQTTAEGDVAIQVGWKTGEMEPCLKAVSKTDAEARQVVQGIARVVCYLSIVLALASFVEVIYVRFLYLLTDEFEVTRGDVPGLGVSQWLVSDGPGLTPASRWALALAPSVMLTAPALIIGTFFLHIGMWPAGWWPFSVLGITVDRCRTLEQMAACLRSGNDISSIMRILAEVYPKHLWRQRLTRAYNYLEAGVPWWHAFVRVGLLNKHQATWLRTLQSGEQMAWGCEELARRLRDRVIRRLVRTRIIVLVFVVLLSGLVVAVLGSTLFELLAATALAVIP